MSNIFGKHSLTTESTLETKGVDGIIGHQMNCFVWYLFFPSGSIFVWLEVFWRGIRIMIDDIK